MPDRPSRPELLAPAGGWEPLRAAVRNGADAVYFGVTEFNARARAHNFEPDELPQVMDELHRHNVRGFLTLNTLIFSDELPAVAEIVRRAAKAGVDAIIVQDLGLVRLIRAIAPTMPIHASTQMTLTEPRGIALAESLGIDRVVLARELSIAEIAKVTAASSVPVEVFVHGALCVAYSGQCLTSEALGGRSANRGQCAQACRLPYELIVDGDRRDLGDRAYLLSPQDLAAFDRIDDLIEAGVVSFKIEGRLKGGPYVAATTQTYRKAIDAKLHQHSFTLPLQDELDLAQTFSRGMTTGFLDGVNHQLLVRGRFPKSRGIRLGTVERIVNRGVRIRLDEGMAGRIHPGDGVLFDLGTPEVQEPAGRVWQVQPIGSTVDLSFEDGSIDLRAIPAGTTVWKTDDPILRKKLEQSYARETVARRVPVAAKLAGTLGGEVTLTLTDEEGLSATANWSGPLEPARKQPTTADEIREQLGRLGETPFGLGAVTIALPEGVILPRSVLNDLRRKASEELTRRRLDARKHEVREWTAENSTSHPWAASKATDDVPVSNPQSAIRNPQFTVLVRSLDQLDAVLPHRPAMVYCDFEDLRRYKEAVPIAKSAGVPIGLATLRIIKPGEDGLHANIVRAEPDAVLIRNLGSLAYYREAMPQAELIGDFSLNVANELTAEWLVSQGCSRLVPSFDLNWDQFAALLKRFDPARLEPVVHQHMPMFHMEHCVFAAFLSTGKDHRDCGRPCDRHRIELNDRVGAAFPVHPDTGCRNTVYNSVPQSAAEYLPRMRELGVRRVRIDLLRETAEQIGPLLETYRSILEGQTDGRDTWKRLKAQNQLGVTRGTLQMV